MINRDNQCNRCENFKECMEDDEIYTGKSKIFLSDFQVLCLFVASLVLNIITASLLVNRI